MVTERERRQLNGIEQEFAAHDPRLARLLCAPGFRVRMLWGPRRRWVAMLSLTAAAALVAVSAWWGLSAAG